MTTNTFDDWYKEFIPLSGNRGVFFESDLLCAWKAALASAHGDRSSLLEAVKQRVEAMSEGEFADKMEQASRTIGEREDAQPVAEVVSDVDDGNVLHELNWLTPLKDIAPGTRLYTGAPAQPVAMTNERLRGLVYTLRNAVRDDSGAGASIERHRTAVAAEEALLAAIETLAAQAAPKVPEYLAVGEIESIDEGNDEDGPSAWVALHRPVKLGEKLYAAPQPVPSEQRNGLYHPLSIADDMEGEIVHAGSLRPDAEVVLFPRSYIARLRGIRSNGGDHE